MNPTNRRIIVDYEDEGGTVEQISESLGVECEAVEAVLMQYSKKYRSETGKGEGDMESKHARLLAAYETIAYTTEDERLRARILENLIKRQEKVGEWKGRDKNISSGISPTRFSVFIFNKALEESRTKGLLNNSVTDVELVEEKM